MKSFILVTAFAAASMAHVAHPDHYDKCEPDACQNVVNTPFCESVQIRTVYQNTSTVYVPYTATNSSGINTTSTRSGEDLTSTLSLTLTTTDDSTATVTPNRRGGKVSGKPTEKGGDDDVTSTAAEDRTTTTTGLPPSVTDVCDGKWDVRSACECIGVPKSTVTAPFGTTVTQTVNMTFSASASSFVSTSSAESLIPITIT